MPFSTFCDGGKAAHQRGMMMRGTMSANGAESADTFITLSSGWKVRQGTRKVSHARPSMYQETEPLVHVLAAEFDVGEVVVVAAEVTVAQHSSFC